MIQRLKKHLNSIKYLKVVLSVAILLIILIVYFIWKKEQLYAAQVTKNDKTSFYRHHASGVTSCIISFWIEEFYGVEFVIASCEIDAFNKVKEGEKIQIITSVKYSEMSNYSRIKVRYFKSKNFYFPLRTVNDKIYDTVVLICFVVIFSFGIVYIVNKPAQE